MPIHIAGNSVVIGAQANSAAAAFATRQIDGPIITGAQSIPFARFPHWHAHHLTMVPDTLPLEQDGKGLIAAGFPFAQLEQFIRGVCRWGGYSGIAGRILKNNQRQDIVNRFQSTTQAFTSTQAVSAALVALNRLSGLGTPSFASKHLRFLRPDICPVLDKLLSSDLTYPFTVTGYQQMADDCRSVACQLNAANLLLPGGHVWGAADVEMSIFGCLHR